jgi:hypothetical protein
MRKRGDNYESAEYRDHVARQMAVQRGDDDAEGDVIRINTGVEMTSIAGSAQEDIVEMPRAEWGAMNDEEREAALEAFAQTTLSNNVNAWAYVVED